jgi:hypothetical protein
MASLSRAAIGRMWSKLEAETVLGETAVTRSLYGQSFRMVPFRCRRALGVNTLRGEILNRIVRQNLPAERSLMYDMSVA